MHAGRGNNHNPRQEHLHVLVEERAERPTRRKSPTSSRPRSRRKATPFTRRPSPGKGQEDSQFQQSYDTYRSTLHSASFQRKAGKRRIRAVEGRKAIREIQTATAATAFAVPSRATVSRYYGSRGGCLKMRSRLKTATRSCAMPPAGTRKTMPHRVLARKGDLPFTLAMAQANAGDPETAVQTFYAHRSRRAWRRIRAAPGGHVYHPVIRTTRTTTESDHL